MSILVTGSAGHLGEAVMRTLRAEGRPARGLDILASEFTDHVGSLVDADFVAEAVAGADAIIHTATLHKPHVETHTRQDFVDTNITGTLNLLEVARETGITRFVMTSTTSTFGDALSPAEGEPAAWITEDMAPIPKNIYGATKTAAEGLCELFARRFGVPVIVLRTSRFFPEMDDSPATRDLYPDENAKANEFLFRRVDIADAVSAHLLALDRVEELGFERLIVSATTPFAPADVAALRRDAPSVVARVCPDYEAVYAARGWRMFPSLDRVYDNARARRLIGWRPEYDFRRIVAQAAAGEVIGSELARTVGIKGYHKGHEQAGIYPFV